MLSLESIFKIRGYNSFLKLFGGSWIRKNENESKE